MKMDWICPECGNVNFSFRNFCNRGTCGVPRPPLTSIPSVMPAPTGSHLCYLITGPPPYSPPGMPYEYLPSSGQMLSRPMYSLEFVPTYGHTSSRKPEGGSDGQLKADWVCRECGNLNYSFRKICNSKKCGAPRPTHGAGSCSSSTEKKDTPDGGWTCSSSTEKGWTCTNCGYENYSSHKICKWEGCYACKLQSLLK